MCECSPSLAGATTATEKFTSRHARAISYRDPDARANDRGEARANDRGVATQLSNQPDRRTTRGTPHTDEGREPSGTYILYVDVREQGRKGSLNKP
jgi:hypothetical protein